MILELPPEATAEERAEMLKKAMSEIRDNRHRQHGAALAALDAIGRLAAVMQQKTGQSYLLRPLLHSLWSNQPGANLCDVLTLDWTVREDLCAVMLGFGYESKEVTFFYDQVKASITRAGLWDWFTQQ